ncbi:fasciclin domain-containing protein [Jannaschia marina]|uniref:fasciclin domain-containing protein n=1 Tax=Jannaschia marina TaxID=2741674 RepID=UPI0015CEAAE6|nr:fasciclin domain-containing protein [Jannaschia marina]
MKRLALLLCLAFASAAAAQTEDLPPNPEVGGGFMAVEDDILTNLRTSAEHTTFVKLAEAAGLEATLATDGPFTLFAPDDKAFADLPGETVARLLSPEARAELTRILTCHVVPDALSAEALADQIAAGQGRAVLDTLGGCTLIASGAAEGLTLRSAAGGEAAVQIADIRSTNGLFHVIDKAFLSAAVSPRAGVLGGNPTIGGAVMRPSASIMENLIRSPEHTILVQAIQTAGLVDILQSGSEVTLFAPPDSAFEALPEETRAALLDGSDTEALGAFLRGHMVEGRLTQDDLLSGLQGSDFNDLRTLSGDALAVQRSPSGDGYVFDERGIAHLMTTPDVVQRNGVLHVIEGLLRAR